MAAVRGLEAVNQVAAQAAPRIAWRPGLHESGSRARDGAHAPSDGLAVQGKGERGRCAMAALGPPRSLAPRRTGTAGVSNQLPN